MPTLTAIVTAGNDTIGLKYTLEGLVEQSTEDFGVIIVDNGCDKPAKDIIEQYCKDYVGFEYIETECMSIPAARNTAVEKCKSEYFLFIDCCDYISPESIESFLNTAQNTKADILCPRFYFSGTNEPSYDSLCDMLAVVPKIDKFDNALINTLDYDGRVFSRKFFDMGMRFPDSPVLYNTMFLSSCLYEHDASLTGVAGAIYDRKNGVFFDDFTPGTRPCRDTLEIYVSVYEKILAKIMDIIKAETGTTDGDEYTIQEFLSVYFDALTKNFYRLFWYLTDEEITMLKDKYEAISSHMTQERRKSAYNRNSDLKFPGMYMCRKDAANMPFFSLLLDFNSAEFVRDFIRVLYVNNFPFFEVYIRESLENYIPEDFAHAENMHIIPDKSFFAEARKSAKGIPINVKDPSPLDSRILSQLALSKAPRNMIQYMFSAKRKKYAAKTYLKNKGMQLQ